MAYLAQSATNTQGMDYNALLYCKTNLGGYFFDGFLSIDHEIETEITEHPVETGAAVVDHSYIKPKKLTMEIVVSDAHQSFIPGQFTGKTPRHVGAWNLLKQLQADRIPLSVYTKLGSYDNMLIKKISTTDDKDSYNALFATVELQEIPVVRVRTVRISSAPQVTETTKLDEKQPTKTDQTDVSYLYSNRTPANTKYESTIDRYR